MARLVQKLLDSWTSGENTVDCFLGMLKLCGLFSINQNKPRKGWMLKRHRWNQFVPLVQFVTMTTLCPVTAYYYWGNLMSTCELVGAFFVLGLVVVHFASLLYRGEFFEKMVAALEEMRALGRLHQDHPEQVARVGMRLSRIAVMYYIGGSSIITIMGLFVIPVQNLMNRELLIKYVWPYDYKKAPNFEILMLVMNSTGFYAILLVVLVNSLLLSIFAQITFELALLNHNIASIVTTSKPIEDPSVNLQSTRSTKLEPPAAVFQRARRTPDNLSPTKEIKLEIGIEPFQTTLNKNPEIETNLTEVGWFGEDIYSKISKCSLLEAEKRLKLCVQHHQVISSAIAEFQLAFGPILLVQLSCAVFPVIIAIVLVLYAEVFDGKIYYIFGLMAQSMAQQGLICFLSEKVTEGSEAVRDAVFSCDWTGASEGFKRTMRIMMSRCNQPMVVTVAHGIPLSMATFSEVLKMTYSSYTSLAAMMDSSLKPTHER